MPVLGQVSWGGGCHWIFIFLFSFNSKFLEISRSIITLSLRVPDVASNLCLKKMCSYQRWCVGLGLAERSNALPTSSTSHAELIIHSIRSFCWFTLAASMCSPIRLWAMELILYARHDSRQRDGTVKRHMCFLLSQSRGPTGESQISSTHTSC